MISTDDSKTMDFDKLAKFVKLNEQFVPHIFRYVAVDVLVVAGSTSRSMRALCQKEMRERFTDIAREYVDDISRFSRVLLGSQAVISGSSVLPAIDPSNTSWSSSAKDLDLYVSILCAPQLIDHLTDVEGYEEVSKNKKRGPGTRGHVGEVFYLEGWKGGSLLDVKIFKRPSDGKRIDVMISKSLFASTLPIFDFHTTIVMNYMTPTLIFCAYPKYTLDKVGLINCRAVFESDEITGEVVVYDRVKKAISKYNQRGYRLEMSPHYWDSDHAKNCPCGHQCRGHRTTLDRYCLIFPYGSYTNLEDDFSTRVSFNWGGVLPGGHVEWSIGGHACVDVGEFKNAIYKPCSHRI